MDIGTTNGVMALIKAALAPHVTIQPTKPKQIPTKVQPVAETYKPFTPQRPVTYQRPQVSLYTCELCGSNHDVHVVAIGDKLLAQLNYHTYAPLCWNCEYYKNR